MPDRLGRFQVDWSSPGDPVAAARALDPVFRTVTVLQKTRISDDVTEYVATSPHFDEWDEPNPVADPPLYTATATIGPDDVVRVVWRKA